MKFKVGDRVVIDAANSSFHGRLASIVRSDLSDDTYYIRFDGDGDELIWTLEKHLRYYLNGVQLMMECL
jgi:hypothetical protein